MVIKLFFGIKMNIASFYKKVKFGFEYLLNVLVSENSKFQLFDIKGKQVVSGTNVNAYQMQSIDVSTLAIRFT